MRVLHIVKTSVGAAWVYRLVRVAQQIGLETAVVIPSDTGLAPLYRACGAQVVCADLDFPLHKPWQLPARLARCREIVQEIKPDVIHTHHVGTTCVARVALGKQSAIPRVYQVAGPLHLESWPYARLELTTAGPADWWIATCRWTQHRYEQLGVPSARVFQTYAGTDVSQFRPGRSGKLRRELGISGAAPLVGLVSYIYAPKLLLGQTRGIKGHEDFIAAFQRLLKGRADARGVIVGGTWGEANGYEHRLREMARKTCGNSLQMLGHRNDIAEIYPDFDVAVVPSLSENLGGAVEPMLCGVPVVATSVGGLPDIVREGETGWLVPPGNPAAMTAAIERVLASQDEAKQRASKGEKLVRYLLDAERTARETISFYKVILRGAGCSEACR